MDENIDNKTGKHRRRVIYRPTSHKHFKTPRASKYKAHSTVSKNRLFYTDDTSSD